MSLIESFEFIAKLLKEFCIFRTRSAASAILACQTALGRGLAVAKFTNRSMEACWAIASLMAEAIEKNVRQKGDLVVRPGMHLACRT